MKTPSDIVLRRVLVGHRAAVNVVDFDDRYIVSASGDRTIKVRMRDWRQEQVVGVVERSSGRKIRRDSHSSQPCHDLYSFLFRCGRLVIVSLFVRCTDTGEE